MFLDELPDIVLINLFDHMPYADRLRAESVCQRFRELIREIWYRKTVIVFPYDIWEINRGYPLSSYLDTFRKEMSILIEHCPNADVLDLQNFRRLQVVMQPSSMTYFQRPNLREFSTNLRELRIGDHYVTDVDVVREMAAAFPNLQTLAVDFPYPLVHRIRPDTVNYLRKRIANLEPQLWTLMDDNNRVTEDMRMYLEQFRFLKNLRLKKLNFNVVPVSENETP